MSLRIVSVGALLAALCWFTGRPEAAGVGGQEKPADLNGLSMEVDALQTLRALEPTGEQLKNLGEVAASTAGEMGKRAPAKASAKYAKLLADFRAALVANDEDAITELEEKVSSLADDEGPALDDGVEITDAAREKTPAVLRTFTAGQVATYISTHTDDFADPNERLAQGLADGRTMKGAEWKETRDEIAEDVSQAVAGLDSGKATRVAGEVKALLDRAQKMKAAEYKAEAEALRKAARALVGEVGPTDVIKNHLERVVATLLSNPRLPAVLAARTKADSSR